MKVWLTESGGSAGLRLWYLYFSRWKAAIPPKIRRGNSFRLRDSIRAAIKTPSPARIDRPRAQHFHRERARGRGRELTGVKLREERQRAHGETYMTRGLASGERVALPPRRSRIYHPDISKCRAVYQVFPGGNLKVPWHELANGAARRVAFVREYEHRIGYVIKFT